MTGAVERNISALDPQSARTRPAGWVMLALALFTAGTILWPVSAIDMDAYLRPWLRHILAEGPIGAFAMPFSNYSPPYLYALTLAAPLTGMLGEVAVVKLVGVAGLVWSAVAVHRLLRAAGAEPSAAGSALLLLLPTTLINGPLLGQCDGFWAAAALTALTHAVRKAPFPMLVWCGIAFAIKAQAIFLAPFVLAYLLAERVPLRLWPLTALGYIGLLLPAWAAGWPAADLLTIYLRQADHFVLISANAPNLWAAARMAGIGLEASGVALAAAAAATILYVSWLRHRRLDAGVTVLAALLAVLLVPGLLPKMHDRFFFLADLLAFAYVRLAPGRYGLTLLVATQLGSLLALLAFLLGEPWLAAVGAVPMITATIGVGILLARRLPVPAPAKAAGAGLPAGDADDRVQPGCSGGRSTAPGSALIAGGN